MVALYLLLILCRKNASFRIQVPSLEQADARNGVGGRAYLPMIEGIQVAL